MREMTYDDVVGVNWALVDSSKDDTDSIDPPGVKSTDPLYSTVARSTTGILKAGEAFKCESFRLFVCIKRSDYSQDLIEDSAKEVAYVEQRLKNRTSTNGYTLRTIKIEKFL